MDTTLKALAVFSSYICDVKTNTPAAFLNVAWTLLVHLIAEVNTQLCFFIHLPVSGHNSTFNMSCLQGVLDAVRGSFMILKRISEC